MTMELIKKLRNQTGAGFMDCKKALEEVKDNFDNAVDYLRKKGIAKAAAKAERSSDEGLVESYIHLNGRIGVLVEVNCETDFVALTDEFKTLAHDIAMHIAASNPICVTRDEVDPTLIEREKEVYLEQLKQEGKPANMLEKIVEGKVEKYYQEICLLEQPFIKNPDKTINDLIIDAVAKIGENIQIKRFSRFVLGEK